MFDEGSGTKIVFAKGRARKLIKTKTNRRIYILQVLPKHNMLPLITPRKRCIKVVLFLAFEKQAK